MTTSHEFQGLDFDLALGEVYGMRTWKVDGYGRLRALHVTGAGAWRPGINVATCHRGDYSSTGWYNAGGFVFPKSFVNAVYGDLTKAVISYAPGTTPEPEKPKEVEPPHEIPVESCQCGFYAYTDPKHEETSGYNGAEYATGIIRGTGRTLIGTKGFRSEEAEIVALLDPTRGGRKKTAWRVKQRSLLERNYPDVPLLKSRDELRLFAPIEPTLPDPSTDEFWSLP